MQGRQFQREDREGRWSPVQPRCAKHYVAQCRTADRALVRVPTLQVQVAATTLVIAAAAVPRVEWQGRGLGDKDATLGYVVAAATADVEATAATTPGEIPTSTTGGVATAATSGGIATSATEDTEIQLQQRAAAGAEGRNGINDSW